MSEVDENPTTDMSRIAERLVDYVIWQNRATRFYIGARLNYLNSVTASALYNAFIALELLLKATLVYHDSSFRPRDFGHNFRKLTRTLHNKVRNSSHIRVPLYYSHDDRLVNVTRYPDDRRGVLVPATFLTDLDRCFYELLVLTPFQHNTELKRILRQRRGPERTAFAKSNSYSRRMRAFLRVRQRAAPSFV